MGCCPSSANILPEEILEDPGQSPCSFVVKRTFDRNCQVFTDDDRLWLFLRCESGFFDPDCRFELETYRRDEDGQGEVLASVRLGPEDWKAQRDVDWEGDSDDSDYSDSDDDGDTDDDDDDDDDGDEVKLKLKWSLAREARFFEAGGEEFARMKFKIKGKSKAHADLSEAAENGLKSFRCEYETKVKKAFYKLTVGPGKDEVDIEVENGNWADLGREWSCALFDAEHGYGNELEVDTKGEGSASNALVVAVATGFFFHPALVGREMNTRVQREALSILNSHQLQQRMREQAEMQQRVEG